MLNFDLSLATVLFTGIVGFLVGALFYSDYVFGGLYRRIGGRTVIENEEGKKDTQKNCMLGLLANLVFAFFLAALFNSLVPVVLVQALVLGFQVWLGFITTFYFSSVLWEKTPVKVFLLNSLHNLVTILVMSAILFYYLD